SERQEAASRGLFCFAYFKSTQQSGEAPGSHPLRAEPGIDVFSGLVLGDAVSLLDYALELIAAAGDPIQVIVGEIAPFLFHAAFQLLPVSFNAIPIHEYLLCHLTRPGRTRGYTP